MRSLVWCVRVVEVVIHVVPGLTRQGRLVGTMWLSTASEACLDGTREFTRRRLILVERLSGVAERLTGRLDDAVGAHREFARRFIEGIRNTLGDR
ncbi:hypothetical protein BHM03_00004134 [Ensete ventricosum]|nr:hypothetical protein BHM03_00004134 [Ensete ventricosum]